MSADSGLTRLLEHPAIWRGRSVARTEVIPTGFDALDECLPGGGWPRTGLMEILVSSFCVGELYLLLPALAALTQSPAARWCVWTISGAASSLTPQSSAKQAGEARDDSPASRPDDPAASRAGLPPGADFLHPFAPALAAHGMALRRMLVVRAPAQSMWAFEQSLGSGACDAVMTWERGLRAAQIRRLQLAAERGRALGILFRPLNAARESSPAILRLALEPVLNGVRIAFLKSRGGARGTIEIAWQRRVALPEKELSGRRAGPAEPGKPALQAGSAGS